jgi:DDE superfamily endonuclease
VLHRALVCDDVGAGHRGAVGKRSAHGHRNVAGGGPGRAGALVTRAPVLLPGGVGPGRRRPGPGPRGRGPPDAGAVTVAVDDTLFHRYGRKVHGARYQHDGSAKGRDGIGRGNCFVIVGVVAAVPFLARQVCLPVLFRLHIPKTGASKTEQARALVDLLAQALPGRTIHVVGDAPYRGPAWRGLPARVTFTTRLAANAVLHRPEPPRTGRRGHPAWKGQRLGTAADMAATTTTTWTRTRVTRDGVTEDVDMAVITCLWWGSLHRTPIRVVLVRDTGETRPPYTLALATTDLTSTGEQIVARYASRWSIEMVFPQLAKAWVGALGCDRQHVADLHLAVGDDHPVDEQLHQQPPLRERGRGQPVPDGLAEALDPVGDSAELQPLSGDRVQLALLVGQGGPAALQLPSLALQLRQGDDLGQVGL